MKTKNNTKSNQLIGLFKEELKKLKFNIKASCIYDINIQSFIDEKWSVSIYKNLIEKLPFEVSLNYQKCEEISKTIHEYVKSQKKDIDEIFLIYYVFVVICMRTYRYTLIEETRNLLINNGYFSLIEKKFQLQILELDLWIEGEIKKNDHNELLFLFKNSEKRFNSITSKLTIFQKINILKNNPGLLNRILLVYYNCWYIDPQSFRESNFDKYLFSEDLFGDSLLSYSNMLMHQRGGKNSNFIFTRAKILLIDLYFLNDKNAIAVKSKSINNLIEQCKRFQNSSFDYYKKISEYDNFLNIKNNILSEKSIQRYEEKINEIKQEQKENMSNVVKASGLMISLTTFLIGSLQIANQKYNSWKENAYLIAILFGIVLFISLLVILFSYLIKKKGKKSKKN